MRCGGCNGGDFAHSCGEEKSENDGGGGGDTINTHVLTICTFHIHILSQIIFIRVIFRKLHKTYIHGILGILN